MYWTIDVEEEIDDGDLKEMERLGLKRNLYKNLETGDVVPIIIGADPVVLNDFAFRGAPYKFTNPEEIEELPIPARFQLEEQPGWFK